MSIYHPLVFRDFFFDRMYCEDIYSTVYELLATRLCEYKKALGIERYHLLDGW